MSANPKHETKFHVPVGQESESPGVSVCELHQGSFQEVFDRMRSLASRNQIIWTFSVLSAVAVFYGVTLWTSVNSRASDTEARVTEVKEQVTIQRVKLEYIEETVRSLKTGQEFMQKDMNARFEELRKEMQRLNAKGAN
jgi:hypothetical protein